MSLIQLALSSLLSAICSRKINLTGECLCTREENLGSRIRLLVFATLSLYLMILGASGTFVPITWNNKDPSAT